MSEAGAKISVVIAAYNAESYLEAAVSSVLAQDVAGLEVVIVDDGSSDGTPELICRLCADSRVRSLQHPGGVNRGPSCSRELGVHAAKGEYICFLDADDKFLPGKIERQIEAMSRHPRAVMCHTAVRSLEQAASTADFVQHFSLGPELLEYALAGQPDFLEKNRIANSSAMILRSALDGLSFGVQQLFQFEDWLLWLLLSERGSFVYLPEPLIDYRYHPSSATYYIHRVPLLRDYALVELCLMLRAKSGSQSELSRKAKVRLERVLERIEEKYRSPLGHQTLSVPERLVRALGRVFGR
ncbi:MAG TPA: glycosyltransferase [Oligoflexia bacterium]|nr:glycosyltransferase [Oligoflexia bacterium]